MVAVFMQKNNIQSRMISTQDDSLQACLTVGISHFRVLFMAVHKLLQFSQKVAPIFSKSWPKVAPKL